MDRSSFNTHTQGRLVFGLFASQAEFEHKLISKRGGERVATPYEDVSVAVLKDRLSMPRPQP